MHAAEAVGEAMRGVGTGITLKSYFDNMATADAWKRGLDIRPGRGGEEGVTDPYGQSGPFKRGVDLIADAVSSVPFKIYKRAKKLTQEVEIGPVYDLFRAPNPLLSRSELFRGTVVYLKRDGKCVWYYDVFKGKMPGEIWPLNPRCMNATKDDRGMLTGWTWKAPGAKVETPIPLDRASYFKQFNPDDISDGLPDITGGKMDLDQEYWAKVFMSSAFRNGTELGNIFTSDKPLDKDAARAIMDALSERQGGPGKAKRDILIQAGMKVERAGTTPKDMEYSGLQHFAREETLGNLGVPPILAGVLEYANYANGRTQERIFWNMAVQPVLRHLTEGLDSSFFARYAPELIGQFDTDDVAALKDDTGEKIGWGKTLWDMGVPANVINKLLDIGWDPKDVPWGNDVFVPPFSITAREAVKQTALDLAPDVAPAPTPAPAPPADMPDEEPMAPMDEGKGRFALALARKDDPNPRFAASFLKTEEKRAAYWKGAIRSILPIERGYKGKLGTYFAAQGRDVLGRLLARGKMLRGVVKEAVDQEVEAILFDMEEEGAKLRVLSRPYFRESMKAGAARILADIDVGDPWKVDNPRAQALLAKQLKEVVGINDTTRDALRATLTEGLGKGESIQDLAGRVRATYDVAGSSRARTIARTEIGQASNSAGFEALQDAGVKKHEWLSARDSAVRDDHAPGSGEDGNIVNIGDPFPVTGLLYPQDPLGDPATVINCRCVAIGATE